MITLIDGSDFMSQRQIGINKKSSISIVAVFGLLTMSSSVEEEYEEI